MSRTPKSLAVADLISLSDVVAITGLRERTLSLYTQSGEIPSLKIGHARLFDRRVVTAWAVDRQRRRDQLRKSRQLARTSRQRATGRIAAGNVSA